MRKRIVMLILAALCTIGSGITAAAQDYSVPSSIGSNVYGTYQESKPAKPVYNVDINWGNMNFYIYSIFRNVESGDSSVRGRQ